MAHPKIPSPLESPVRVALITSAIPTRACFAKPLSAHVPLSQPVPSRMDLLKTMWLNACAAKKNATLEVVSFATRRLVRDLAATQIPVGTVSI
jgi:hypothetical protein